MFHAVVGVLDANACRAKYNLSDDRLVRETRVTVSRNFLSEIVYIYIYILNYKSLICVHWYDSARCIEKFAGSNLLNKRSEFISRCRHENKYFLMNFKDHIT